MSAILRRRKILTEAEVYLESAKVDDDVLDRIEQAYLNNERAQATARNAAASIENGQHWEISACGSQVRIISWL